MRGIFCLVKTRLSIVIKIATSLGMHVVGYYNFGWIVLCLYMNLIDVDDISRHVVVLIENCLRRMIANIPRSRVDVVKWWYEAMGCHGGDHV